MQCAFQHVHAIVSLAPRVVRAGDRDVAQIPDREVDGAEKIEIIDKSGGNSITIDTASNAITITSAADVTIDAPQGTLKLSAQTIEITSSANTEVKASGNLSLEASGTATLKGATVNIN